MLRCKALYAGSFDPFTLGHMDIVKQAIGTFEEVHIAIGTNPKKTRLFTVEESLAHIRHDLIHYLNHDPTKSHSRITIGEYTGKSIARYAREVGASHIVRGLRQVSDFNDEFQLNGAINEVAPYLYMTYFISSSKYLHVSSSMARELASLGEPIQWLVSPFVEKALFCKFL